jgi:hypothetical protein
MTYNNRNRGFNLSFTNYSANKIVSLFEKSPSRIFDPQRITYLETFSNPLNGISDLSFLRAPIKYDAGQSKIIDRLIPDVSSINDPHAIFDLALQVRDEYIRDHTNNQYLLQYAYTLFCIALYGFECNDLRGPIPLGRYFECSRTYRNYFSEILKKVRNICMISSLADGVTNEFIEYKEDILNEFKRMLSFPFLEEDHIHYDSLLNEQYLIHYEETVDDYKNAFVESSYDESMLETFEEYAEHLLRLRKVESLSRPLDTDIMTWISDSKTYDSSENTLKVNRNMMRENPTSRGSLTCHFRFYRSIVNVAPANVRDTFICDKDTLYTTKYLSFLLRQIIDEIDYSAMTSDVVKAIKRKRSLKEEACNIMLDFKKCGLTIPHRTINIISDVLIKIYPDFEDVFNCLKGYSNATLKFDNEEKKILRGTGLGNGNELCTLIGCVVAHYFRVLHDWKSIVYNDDSVWNYRNHNKKDSIDCLLSFFEGIGFEVNLRKTFISRFNVFCEEYFAPEEKDWTKRQLFFLPLAGLFLQNSTANAKRFYSSYCKSLIGTNYGIDHYFIIIKKLYGVEFHEFEYVLPLELGGWKNYNNSNVSCIIDLLNNPKSYLSSWQYSYKRIIFQFVHYLLSSGKTSLEGFFETSIKYSSSKILKFIDSYKHHKIFDIEETIAKIYDITSEEQYHEIDEALLNTRGLHNCRPRLRLGLDRKSQFSRKRFFRLFWKIKDFFPGSYDHNLDGYVINLLRAGGISDTFRIPEQLYEKFSSDQSLIQKKGKITIVRGRMKSIPSIKNIVGSEQIQLFLSARGKILPGTDIFYFYRLKRQRQQFTYRSTKSNMIPNVISVKEIPLFWRMYSRNLPASLIDLCTHTRTNIIPTTQYKNTDSEICTRLEKIVQFAFDVPDHQEKVLKKFTIFQKKVLSGYIYIHGLNNKLEFLNVYEKILDIEQPKRQAVQIDIPRSVMASSGRFREILYGLPDIDELLEMEENLSEIGSEINYSDSKDDQGSDYNQTPEDSDIELDFNDRATAV